MSHTIKYYIMSLNSVWNLLPDNLRNPAVGPDQFRQILKTTCLLVVSVSLTVHEVFVFMYLHYTNVQLLTYFCLT